MKQATKILDLMDASVSNHDIQWLKESLQAAIELEFATIPPYLCAMWSVKSGMGATVISIREIIREEMLHMGLVCNMLTAIGGTPKLNDSDFIPSFPGLLPGGVNPNLTIYLQGLSKDAVKDFMEIEYPESGPVALRFEQYSTIGAFYTAILDAFEKNQPALLTDKQMNGPLGLSKITSLEEIREAINLIKKQGEGSNDLPEDTGPADLAHYYRFGEIYHEKKLRKNSETGGWEYEGDAVPFPDAWAMAKTPLGGYLEEDVSSEVWQLLRQCDEIFTNMMSQLQDAWENGNRQALFQSIPTMLSLRSPAVKLMKISIPSGGGNYGPCFRLISSN